MVIFKITTVVFVITATITFAATTTFATFWSPRVPFQVRDAFELAKEKIKDGDRKGAIIFIDELDAIGTKRFGGEQSGDREVQRTMLELLSQLDGFSSNDKIKVIAATNRPDVLDPALLRSGRLDRKIELPHPNEEARARIMQVYAAAALLIGWVDGRK